jgi:hypothetical protein
MAAGQAGPKVGAVEERCPRGHGELVAEIDEDDVFQEAGSGDHVERVGPRLRQLGRGTQEHADVVAILAEPGGQRDADAVPGRRRDEVDEAGQHPHVNRRLGTP